MTGARARARRIRESARTSPTAVPTRWEAKSGLPRGAIRPVMHAVVLPGSLTGSLLNMVAAGSAGILWCYCAVRWNDGAYEILGGCDETVDERTRLTMGQGELGRLLPAAVREWYLLGGDRRLASVSSNLIAGTRDFASRPVTRFADNVYLLLETDSQHCCQWVVAISRGHDDRPVYLVDADDDTCTTRTVYAATFSDYSLTAAWDAILWAGELATGFDHPLPPGALDALTVRLTALPARHGWAVNQGCETVYRFDGAAKVVVAVTGETRRWGSAIAASSAAMRDALATLIGAIPPG